MFHSRLIIYSLGVGLLALPAQGGPLTEAHVTKIINKVRVVDPSKGEHSASLQEVIKDEIELRTGVKSRSELVFQDNTLTRIGPETSFSFKAGTREMSLERGTMLLQVPKGLGGAKIHTAAVTAAITGTTILMEYTPKKHIKVLVLEGSLRLSSNDRFGNSVVLRPGRMIIMRPDAKRIPAPVSVDLKRIVSSSSLVNMSEKDGPKLPSDDLIAQEISRQEREKGNANLLDTGLVINGEGTVARNTMGGIVDILARTEQGRDFSLAVVNPVSSNNGGTAAPTPAPTPIAGSSPVSTPAPTPVPALSPVPTPAPGASAAPTPTLGLSPQPTPVPGASPVISPDPQPTPVPGASPVVSPAPQPTPATSPVVSPAPQPPPVPSPSPSNDDDKGKGDHNGDGHGDNGKDKTKKIQPMVLAPPAPSVVRLPLSAPMQGVQRELTLSRGPGFAPNVRAPSFLPP
ncbi:MAG: hypothetical protein QOH88_523 [Verrucomicrobiota bacterium]|jgi:hypothetical protein